MRITEVRWGLVLFCKQLRKDGNRYNGNHKRKNQKTKTRGTPRGDEERDRPYSGF